jgi:hypothetical protein
MLALRVGEGSGPFLRVVTSTQARAYETAIAMGFAVDEQSELMSMPGDEVEREIPWSQSFASYAVAVERGGAGADLCKAVARVLPSPGCDYAR